jgi:hypothetical protein
MGNPQQEMPKTVSQAEAKQVSNQKDKVSNVNRSAA